MNPAIDAERVATVLGAAAAEWLERVLRQARRQDRELYLVGGVVRDLILGKPTSDIDLMLEGDAIGFARSLVREYGGRVEAHVPFGTAKWILPATQNASPHHIDFSMARRETYAHAAALPTVAHGTIADDMARRDFSINALAWQLDDGANWRLIDLHGALNDLSAGLIRVLHDASFKDDPTRIFRAFRFAARFDFAIEAHTADLLRTALPCISKLSGARIRNEIDQIFREEQPERIIGALNDLGLFARTHPAFRISARLADLLPRCRQQDPIWRDAVADKTRLYWLLLLDGVNAGDARQICQRLDLDGDLTRSILSFARLAANSHLLQKRNLRPSQITRLLDDAPFDSLHALWICQAPDSLARKRIDMYMREWRHRRATITGDDLKRRQLAPGPRYREILQGLREAWLDGEIRSAEDERALLDSMMAPPETAQ